MCALKLDKKLFYIIDTEISSQKKRLHKNDT